MLLQLKKTLKLFKKLLLRKIRVRDRIIWYQSKGLWIGDSTVLLVRSSISSLNFGCRIFFVRGLVVGIVVRVWIVIFVVRIYIAVDC